MSQNLEDFNTWDILAGGSGSSSPAVSWRVVLVSTSMIPKTNRATMMPVSMRAAVLHENRSNRLCRTSEKKMPPRGAPSVTHPVAIPFFSVNHWLTTLNAIVVGVAVPETHAPPGSR